MDGHKITAFELEHFPLYDSMLVEMKCQCGWTSKVGEKRDGWGDDPPTRREFDEYLKKPRQIAVEAVLKLSVERWLIHAFGYTEGGAIDATHDSTPDDNFRALKMWAEVGYA